MQSITQDTIIQLFNATYTAQHVAFCKFPAETLVPFSMMTEVSSWNTDISSKTPSTSGALAREQTVTWSHAILID
jgi:hypothetical protein